MDDVKVKIPNFLGTYDLKAYLDWEMKVDQIFICNNFSEEKKMWLASLEFEGYALVWWNQILVDKERLRRHRVDTWMVMKRIMRERFVPPHYVREMHNKLQRLYQECKSVDDYYKEIEISLIRANIEETNEATMARYLNGLNREIQDVVELQSYNNMDELIHRAVKVEQQLKRKQTYKKTSYTYSSWKDKDTSKKKGSSSQHLERNSSREDDGFLPPEEGDLLMVKRLMGNLCKDKDNMQRENIFHSRCLVNGKVCSLIIDGGSCTNVASTRLVKKLGLKTTPYPKPYKLQWLSDNGELVVDKQVLLIFYIGNYVDDVLCDMVPMEAGHVLLRRPWQYDRDVVYNGVTNRYSILHKGKKVVLSPLSPSEEFEDVFPQDIPHGLPPLKGVEHQIDLFSGASLPNRAAYRSNLEETKEIQKQVKGLIQRGWVKESLSPCAMPVILVAKKDGTWRMCTDCRPINNITVSLTLDDHLYHVRSVLEMLRHEKLFANRDKCTFCTNQVVFLGFVVSASPSG
ncbi:uncharacterized protein LOC114398673 [Glycine soja]|uniref:uncharacterized protein LOC114398673 n=1 Tax=Glycine soja TaxID=3848 RepID=UPI00103DD692|nr:uncharacterized protein LOC114398673 [Glycine soja]